MGLKKSTDHRQSRAAHTPTAQCASHENPFAASQLRRRKPAYADSYASLPRFTSRWSEERRAGHTGAPLVAHLCSRQLPPPVRGLAVRPVLEPLLLDPPLDVLPVDVAGCAREPPEVDEPVELRGCAEPLPLLLLPRV